MFEKRTVDISTGIIFRTILIILLIWLLYLVRDVIAIFFIALIFSAAIDPPVDWLSRKKIPRPFSVLIVFVIVFFVAGLVISFLVPALINQVNEFTTQAPQQFERLSSTLQNIDQYFQSKGIKFQSHNFFAELGNNLTKLSGEIFSTTLSVFAGGIAVIAILSMTFYLSVKEEGMQRFLASITPAAHQNYVVSLAERMRAKIGKWLQGQILIIIIIFALDYVVLSLLGVPYALILAIFGGLLEIIPYLGPIIAAIPAIIIGFLVSPITGLLVLAAYIVIQQFENHVITPQVMRKAVGLNPVAVILALLIGAKLGGVLGAILAIPVTTALSVFIKDLIIKKEKTENQEQNG